MIDAENLHRYNHKPEIEAEIEIIKLLIDKGGDINASTRVGAIIEDGRTPLYNAAESGRKEIVELLIEKGANVNAKDFENKTPLDEAINYKHNETADLLRKHGAKTGQELKAEGK